MARSLRIAAIAGLATCAIVSVANAAPMLMSAQPAANSAVTAPKSIRINFNESIDARNSGVVVSDVTGKALGVGKASTNSTNSKQLIVPIDGNLPPGKYSVAWHAMGLKSDKGEGTLTFEVKP